MKTDTVYQTVEFEAADISNPEIGDLLEEWGLPGGLEDIPADTMDRLIEDKAFIILNKSSGSIGVVDSATLALNFNEYHPEEGGLGEIRRTFIENILHRAKQLDAQDESEDFYRGMNAILDIIQDAQAGVE